MIIRDQHRPDTKRMRSDQQTKWREGFAATFQVSPCSAVAIGVIPRQHINTP